MPIIILFKTTLLEGYFSFRDHDFHKHCAKVFV